MRREPIQIIIFSYKLIYIYISKSFEDKKKSIQQQMIWTISTNHDPPPNHTFLYLSLSLFVDWFYMYL